MDEKLIGTERLEILEKFIRPSIRIGGIRTPLGNTPSIRIYAPLREIRIGEKCYKKFEPIPICKIIGIPKVDGIWLKGRSEVLIFKEENGILKVFLSLKKREICSMNQKAKYTVPGGKWDENELHENTAYREALEEARIKVKNLKYAAYYIEFGGSEEDKKYVSKKNRWKGYFTEVYMADFDDDYHGKVDSMDKDWKIANGHFYDINEGGEYYNLLHPCHKKVVEIYREKQ